VAHLSVRNLLGSGGGGLTCVRRRLDGLCFRRAAAGAKVEFEHYTQELFYVGASSSKTTFCNEARTAGQSRI
jgi:hypothetical protein